MSAGTTIHAAHGRHDRQSRLPTILKLPEEELSLDFEADDHEEHGHEALVDPLAQIESEVPATEADGELGVPELDVPRLPW